MNPEKSERLRQIAEAIKELKSQHYCGSGEAYAYLKEKWKSLELAWAVVPVLKNEFPLARMPAASEIEDLRRQLGAFLWHFFSLKIYGNINGWESETVNNPQVENAAADWLKKNLVNFALEYYRTVLVCESPEHYTKEAIFIKLCERFLGEIDLVLKDSLQDDAEDLESDLDSYEAERIHEHFNVRQIYQRMVNDRLLHRDDYQRLFIATYLEGLRATYWASAFLSAIPFTAFPKTYDELLKVEGLDLERLNEGHRKNNNDDSRLSLEMFSYLNRTLRRHRSFVEKLIKEYNLT